MSIPISCNNVGNRFACANYSMCVGIILNCSDLLLGVVREQTVAMLANGVNATLVPDSLNKQGLHTRPKDLYNLKQFKIQRYMSQQNYFFIAITVVLNLQLYVVLLI